MADQPTLPAPADQPYTARFSGAASMRSEIEALLAAAPDVPTTQELRALMQDANVAAKEVKHAVAQAVASEPGRAIDDRFGGPLLTLVETLERRLDS